MSENVQIDMDQEFASMNKLYASDIAEAIDPYPMYREYREHMPVMDGDILARYGIPSLADYQRTGRQVYTLFRYDDVARALRDEENFTATIIADGLGQIIGEGVLEGYTGEEHRKLRGIMGRAFTPSNLLKFRNSVMEPRLRSQVQELTANIGAELVSAFSLRFPIDVVYHVLGFPDDRQLSERFAVWAIQSLQGSHPDPEKAEVARAMALSAAQNIFEATLEVVKSRRAAGAEGDDMMAHMIRGEYEGTKLDDLRITKLLSATLSAATETTTRTFNNMLMLLLDRPALLERLSTDRSLMNRVITETMRFEPTASYTARETKKDVEISGVKIPAKTALSLCMASANRDESAFPNADVLDIDRVGPKAHFGFASGAHICLGQHLSRHEIEIAMNAVLDILPRIRRDPEQPDSLIRGLNMRGPDDFYVVWN